MSAEENLKHAIERVKQQHDHVKSVQTTAEAIEGEARARVLRQRTETIQVGRMAANLLVGREIDIDVEIRENVFRKKILTAKRVFSGVKVVDDGWLVLSGARETGRVERGESVYITHGLIISRELGGLATFIGNQDDNQLVRGFHVIGMRELSEELVGDNVSWNYAENPETWPRPDVLTDSKHQYNFSFVRHEEVQIESRIQEAVASVLVNQGVV